MESIPWLMGIVEILQVWAVFVSKNVVVSYNNGRGRNS